MKPRGSSLGTREPAPTPSARIRRWTPWALRAAVAGVRRDGLLDRRAAIQHQQRDRLSASTLPFPPTQCNRTSNGYRSRCRRTDAASSSHAKPRRDRRSGCARTATVSGGASSTPKAGTARSFLPMDSGSRSSGAASLQAPTRRKRRCNSPGRAYQLVWRELGRRRQPDL